MRRNFTNGRTKRACYSASPVGEKIYTEIIILYKPGVNDAWGAGRCNAKEANRLEKREVKLNADEAATKADGKVTHSERMKLQHEANKDSKAIHRQKHNKQTVST